jgi:hypothetical protein
MTKNEFRAYAAKCGCVTRYSGKERKFYINKRFRIRESDIHGLINSRA